MLGDLKMISCLSNPVLAHDGIWLEKPDTMNIG
jgi:hypothetical protein